MALVALATPQATAIADTSLFGRWWSSAFRLTTPIFVGRGPALLFGISRWLSQHGISRKRRNNLTRVLIAVEPSKQESKGNSSHPSSREGHRCAGLWWSGFFGFRPKQNGEGWKNGDRYDGRAHEGRCILGHYVARSHARIRHRDDKRQ